MFHALGERCIYKVYGIGADTNAVRRSPTMLGARHCIVKHGEVNGKKCLEELMQEFKDSPMLKCVFTRIYEPENEPDRYQ